MKLRDSIESAIYAVAFNAELERALEHGITQSWYDAIPALGKPEAEKGWHLDCYVDAIKHAQGIVLAHRRGIQEIKRREN